MRKSIDFAKSIPLDDVTVCQMIPFPGSEMYDIGQKFGLIEKDWERMNLLDVVFIPYGLTDEKLREYQKRFLSDFYLRPRIFFSYLKRLLAAPDNLAGILRGFTAFLRTIFK